ncbi:MAG: phosphoenolpyruvate--protein phosphotransferase [bacterium]
MALEKLTTLEIISEIIARAHTLRELLEQIVHLVAERMGTEVCSIYLLEDELLRLKATVGLDEDAVDTVAMAVDEGLTGLVVEEGEAIAVEDAHSHPRFKYFPVTREERYHSFLGVPLQYLGDTLGVITVQKVESKPFGQDEVKMLKATAGQLSGVIVHARLLDQLHNQQTAEPPPSTVPSAAMVHRGIPAAGGIGVGTVHFLGAGSRLGPVRERRSADPDRERADLKKAVEASFLDLTLIEKMVSRRLSEAEGAIFHTHLLILRDQWFLQRIEEEIANGWSAATAVRRAVQTYVELFGNINDPYLRERAVDVVDVGRRLVANLVGEETEPPLVDVPEETVIVAEEMTPSDLVGLDKAKVKGIVLGAGYTTSHTVILAKSFGIPVVTGVGPMKELFVEGEEIIVDGSQGIVYCRPTDEIRHELERRTVWLKDRSAQLSALRDLPSETLDGQAICLGVNIGLAHEVEEAVRQGAEEIGLYRTEYAFAIRSGFPTEQEQVEIYRQTCSSFGGRSITIRTLDIGGDKSLPYFPIEELNPFLGWRSIRISLDRPDLLEAQLRAILRVSVDYPVRILFPMISGAGELGQALAHLDLAKEQLEREGLPYDPEVPVGLMVEVPGAVAVIDSLLTRVDFVSIGTNDLVQYMLAVDRGNRKVANLYDPLHPAVLEALQRILKAGEIAGKEVSLCGEMAGEPHYVPLLLGLGFRSLSMLPPAILAVKEVVRSIYIADCQALAAKCLAASDSASSLSQLEGFLADAVPDILEGLTPSDVFS